MTVAQILQGVRLRTELPRELASAPVAGLEYDSRRVLPGFLFFAFAGARADGREFAQQALEKGAVAVVSELESAAGFAGPWIQVEQGRHALALGRVFGITFHTAVFTNLTRDHLDFHRTMERYFAAKQLLFAPEGTPAPAWAVINSDDPYGRQIAPAPHTLRYGFEEGADLLASSLEMNFDGLRFTVQHGAERVRLTSPLVGKFNAYNILAACGAALSYGLNWKTISGAIAHSPRVPGRFESIQQGQPFLIVVDYAHTDDALRNVISVARELHPKRVITLFGCGGDRDRYKRPLMAQAAAQASDFVVLTSDNPRSEDPLAIMNDALVGLRRFDTPHTIEPDRAKAIRAALGEAHPGDIVILAGKGHETYQVLKDRVIHFDDREVARSVLRDMGFPGAGV